ncbi:ligase-associated DNA damage response DEXH box helicase [uncultured Cohaesibacter sp.]|uniref:ligase-associated DNA damage response DEXH box helicase n=1 Tax=uncultured Cohaesibacter sp. TaxID=1002546 RepID=UPI0029C8A454|nr:ligase-associated DNA damage response DEXH box helicase [uncultured Cohaesibacter sp.]
MRFALDPEAADAASLPAPFADWLIEKGWQLRPHQQAMLAAEAQGRPTLLIAPTGAGKTLSGFLPSLIELEREGRDLWHEQLHTLYISPLKALAVDIARNLERPIAEMGLDVSVETRTGDTPAHKRQRQKQRPPNFLLTTPEQLALLLASREAETLFASLKTIILDELHALVTSKRGELLSLGLSRLRSLAPDARAVGLSATVADPLELAHWLVPHVEGEPIEEPQIIQLKGGTQPDIEVLESDEPIPWAGHSARYSLPDLYALIKAHKTSLLFVNTRSQAEFLFQSLWSINEDTLPIALHHGSLDVSQRRKVEAAMAAGSLKAVVCTSTLDLGIDWGDIDLVINIGAPKGASRLAQRIGRANHRLDEPSKAILVPSNCFELLECRAALDANYIGDQDTPAVRKGGLDVLAQHILGRACAGPFDPLDLYHEVTAAYPYRQLSWEMFEQAIDFVATGGYAMRAYEQFAKLKPMKDKETGSMLWRLSHPKRAQQYRLNIGTIVEDAMVKVRLTSWKGGSGEQKRLGRSGRVLGEVEEGFIEGLAPGDSFLFAGQVLRFERLDENAALVTRTQHREPKVPAYNGGKFPLSTYLASRVRAMLADPESWERLPAQVQHWLALQKERSIIPAADQMLIETFPRAGKFYLTLYAFEGRLALQTLGMLLTRRLERAGARPLGFVASDYALMIWGLRDLARLEEDLGWSLAQLFDEDMLGDDLESWLAESAMLKRTFRNCAVISGMIERRHPGLEKSGRQITMSSDLIYNVLKEHDPDHLLLKATWDDAAGGLLDIARLGAMLQRIKGRIVHAALDQPSPLAIPVLLEIGREPIYGEAEDEMLLQAAGEMGL